MLRRSGSTGSLAGRTDDRSSLDPASSGLRRATARARGRRDDADSDPPASLGGSERTAGTIPARFRGRARRDAAAFYLSQLARGVLGGEIAVGTDERPVTLATSEFVILEIEVKQKKRANHVAVKLRWPRRPLIRAGGAGRSSHGR